MLVILFCSKVAWFIILPPGNVATYVHIPVKRSNEKSVGGQTPRDKAIGALLLTSVDLVGLYLDYQTFYNLLIVITQFSVIIIYCII